MKLWSRRPVGDASRVTHYLGKNASHSEAATGT